MGALVTSVLFVACIYGDSSSFYVMAFAAVMLLCTLVAFAITRQKNLYRPKLFHESGYYRKVMGLSWQDLTRQEDASYITAHGVLIGALSTGLVLAFLMHGHPHAPYALTCAGMTVLCTIVCFAIKHCTNACRSIISWYHNRANIASESHTVAQSRKNNGCNFASRCGGGVISSPEPRLLEENVGQGTLVESVSDSTLGPHVPEHTEGKMLAVWASAMASDSTSWPSMQERIEGKVLIVSASTTVLDEMSKKYIPGGELYACVSAMLEEGGVIRAR
ncbi:MAG: hypothetical protein ACTJLL_00520 [Anaplasma sp.]